MISKLIKSYNISRSGIEEIRELANYLSKRGGVKIKTAFNILVTYVDLIEGSRFVEDFARLLSRLGNNDKKRVCVCSETELSEHMDHIDRWLRNCHACLIVADGSCDGEKWKSVQAYISRTPETVFVLCGLIDDINLRFRGDDALYYLMFPYHISVMETDSTVITNRLLGMLEERGFEFSEQFVADIEQYNHVVYPKADLGGDEYLRNLFRRVINNHLGGGKEEKCIGTESVPFYKKQVNELGKSTDYTLTKKVGESNSNHSMEGKSIKYSNKLNKTIPFLEVQQTHFDEIKGSKNVLLLSMSTLPPSGAEYCMVEKEGDSVAYQLFSGESQLEPGTKYFISKLALQGIKPDKIIVLTTDETMKPDKSRGGKIARDTYADNIRLFIQEGEHIDEEQHLREELLKQLSSQGLDSPICVYNMQKVKDVYSQNEPLSTDETGWERLAQYIDIQSIPLGPDALQEIMKSLLKLSEDMHVNLFIDLQGGSRSFMFTMFAAVTLLRDKNITIKDAFAIKYQRTNRINPIETVLSEYAILDLVSGIRAFSRYGKVEELQHFLEVRNASDNEKELLERMRRIDECMQINNPIGFTEELDILRSNPAMLDPKNYTDDQFKLVVEDFRSAYGPLFAPRHTVLDQIQWLAEKSFMASALTFVEAMIPDYIVNNPQIGIITIDCEEYSDEQIRRKSGGQDYYSRQTNLFNFEMKKIINNEKERLFVDICNLLADKIINVQNECYSIKINCKVINDIFGGDQNNELLLEVERILLDNNVWGTFSFKTLQKCANNEWRQLRDNLREKMRKNHINYDQPLGEAGLSRRDILSACPNTDVRNQIRLNILKDYLLNHDCTCDMRLVKDIEKVKKFLKICISRALYFLYYGTGKVDEKTSYKIMYQLLQPVLDGSITVLADIAKCFDEDNDRWNAEFDEEKLLYDLWKELMKYYVLKPDQEVDNMAEQYVITHEVIDELERNLEKTIGVPNDSDPQKLEKMMTFAWNYIQCRTAKTAMNDNRKKRKEDRDCSYRNIDIYLQFGDHCKNICEEHFYSASRGGYLTSIAGVKEIKSDWLRDIRIKKKENQQEDQEYRRVLDTCICLYQALRQERNATNHAVKKRTEHMEYRYTQRCVSVFVELCRNL